LSAHVTTHGPRYRRTARWASTIGLSLALAVPLGGIGGAGAIPASGSAASAYGGSLVNYTSSVDAFPLSYYEFLPAGFNSTIAHPLVIYLHGQQDISGVWVKGGIESDLVQDFLLAGSDGVTARAVVNATSAAGMILIALNSRSGSGWYIDSPCGGPQQQDVMDAIHHEESLRNVSKLYLFGMSMGTEGVQYTASLHPGMFAGIGLVAPVTDLFEDIAYRAYLVRTANATDPWAWSSIQAKEYLFCGVGPGTANASERAVDRMLTNMSPLRFDVNAFLNVPIYITAGGGDDRAPDSVKYWPTWLNVNDTLINRTCHRVIAYGEPNVCSVPLGHLHMRSPTKWTFRFVYELHAGHDISQLDPSDMVAFWEGANPGGYYIGGYPFTTITTNTRLPY